MGRPRSKGLDYFPHDCDAVADEKIEMMMAKHGLAGYAFYFIILERTYKNNGKLEFHRSFSGVSPELCEDNATINPENYQNNPVIKVLSRKMWITEKHFIEMLNDAFSIGLFDKSTYLSSGYLTSNGVSKRVEYVEKERERGRAKTTDGSFSGVSPEFLRSFSGVSPEFTPRKEKKRKEKESKENKKIKKKNDCMPVLEKCGNLPTETAPPPPQNGKLKTIRPATTIPENFCVSPSVQQWADKKGFTDLDKHLEFFISACLAKNYKYSDFDHAFRNAISSDWAGVRKDKTGIRRNNEIRDVLERVSKTL